MLFCSLTLSSSHLFPRPSQPVGCWWGDHNLAPLVHLFLMPAHQEQEIFRYTSSDACGPSLCTEPGPAAPSPSLEARCVRKKCSSSKGQENNHYQKHQQHKGGQTASPWVGLKTQHGVKLGCTLRLHSNLQAEAQVSEKILCPTYQWKIYNNYRINFFRTHEAN